MTQATRLLRWASYARNVLVSAVTPLERWGSQRVPVTFGGKTPLITKHINTLKQSLLIFILFLVKVVKTNQQGH